MFSYIGQHFPALAAIMICLFTLMLMSIPISDNLNARRAAKREEAADRGVPSSIKVPSR